jgi:glutamate synthase (NADPH/NADH) large chain
MVFFPKELRLREECREIFTRTTEELGMDVLAWRKVPVNPEDIGYTARSVEPEIEQVFISCPDHITDPMAFERKLFVLRNYASHLINNSVKKDAIGFFLASLSYKVVIYKGQLTSGQVRNYYPDLQNKNWQVLLGLFTPDLQPILFLPGN